MSRFSLYWKVAVIVLLTLVMLIPITMVLSVIDERQSYQYQVVQEISESTSSAQKIVAPILVIPYIQSSLQKDKDGNLIEVSELKNRYVLPENLTINGDVKVNVRKLGIYQAQVYNSAITFNAIFPRTMYADIYRDNIVLQQPYVAVAISDTRGLMQIPQLLINNQSNRFEPGAGGFSYLGIHSPLTLAMLEAEKLDLSFTLMLQGTNRLEFVPVGRTTELKLTSDWPHPNFIGNFLPVNHEINEQGFSAVWQSSWFANNINSYFFDKEEQYLGNLPTFSTSLIETVDQYQLNERTVKYAVLFISLTFVAFFLFEMLKGLKVHPLQYLLVGVALVMFYLILLALSEQIGFSAAYLIASVACSVLIAFYLSAVLKGTKVGIGFGCGLLILYAMLYGLLHLEQYALLMGTLMLFIVLAVIMMLTRKLDWYELVNGGVMEQMFKSSGAGGTGGSAIPATTEASSLTATAEFDAPPSVEQDITDKPVTDDEITAIERSECRLWK